MGSYPPPSDFRGQSPEILPAERDPRFEQELWERTAPPATRPAPRSWAFAPATYLLLGINCLVFVAMVLNHVSMTNPTSLQLLQWGANNPDMVLQGQWWRIVTAMFVHVGIIHLVTNMWCLWNLGLLGEPLIGPFGVFAAYILAGAAGNLLSVGVNEFRGNGYIVGAGASGAVFGLAGLLIVLLKSPRLPVPAAELAGLRRYVIYFAVANFAIGFGANTFTSSVQIDNWAHLGGCLGGMVFALPMVPRRGSPRELFLLRRWVAVGLLTGVLVLFGFYLSNAFTAR
jgi:rhomboid protease GluP